MNRWIVGVVCLMVVSANVKAACNSPNGISVTFMMTGPAVVAVGSTNEYYLGYAAPGTVDVSGGTYTWSYPSDFTVVGSNGANPIKLVAPSTPSASLDDKTIHCEFSKTDWTSSGLVGCEDEKKVTVVKVEVLQSSLQVGAYTAAVKDDSQHAFYITGKANWFIILVVRPYAAKSKVDARLVQTVKGYHRQIYKSPPSGVVGRRFGSNDWNYDGENGNSSSAPGIIILNGSDPPGIGADYLVYTNIQTDLQFEDFIQYKPGTGEWITLEKGSWETHGNATVQPDGNGGYTETGGQSNTLNSDFAPSSESAIEEPKSDDWEWEDY